jgi:hypothetical protein
VFVDCREQPELKMAANPKLIAKMPSCLRRIVTRKTDAAKICKFAPLR